MGNISNYSDFINHLMGTLEIQAKVEAIFLIKLSLIKKFSIIIQTF